MPVPVFNPLQNQAITSAMVNLTVVNGNVTTLETTTSTSYTDLATAGPANTVSSGVPQDHLLLVGASEWNSIAGANVFASPAVGGAGAADTDGAFSDGGSAAIVSVLRQTHAAAQATGAVHTMKYKTGANTGNFQDRRITTLAV